MLEKQVQKQIVDWLRQNNYFCFSTSIYQKNRRISAGNMKGVADIIGIFPDGTLFAIEVKKPKIFGRAQGKTTLEQIEFMQHITARNGCAVTAMSIDCVRQEFTAFFLRKSLANDLANRPVVNVLPPTTI